MQSYRLEVDNGYGSSGSRGADGDAPASLYASASAQEPLEGIAFLQVTLNFMISFPVCNI